MSRDELAGLVVGWLAEHDDKGREAPFDATETELGLGTPSSVEEQASSVWNHDKVVMSVETTTRNDLATTRRQALAALALTGPVLTKPLQRWLDPIVEDWTTDRNSSFNAPEIETLEACQSRR